ncbi:FAD-dependent oxidoreductase [Conexivisphaera calida]|uniref:Anaerobic glycerol-3-phosphate dehydrogenase subunit A n=1 Tax=Conexivisphaera calida TaxID=1874277 RepID=A0A4P2VC17_9ARCH|nr:FAD-dependent oxidoreductase [Conexivisphaera calida]BBE42089.1 Anaerobic glycerol-3-phosphate dehydrogenase subunit A [Conexivisphaera calida]
MPSRAIVVGAGITGAFTALDLALRGADVVLVERGRSPDGATSRIEGVVHGGARFAVTAPAAAAACRDENPRMRAIARDFLLSDHGYFLVTDATTDDYMEKFLSSAGRLGIRAVHSDPPMIDGLRPGAVRGALETSDALIDLQEFLLHLIWRAVEEGVEYVNSADLESARPVGDHEWEISIRRGSSSRAVRGALVLAAGHGIPGILRGPMGLSPGEVPQFGVARGSHVLLRLRVPTVIQILHEPGTGDLMAPSRGGTFVGPTLVPGGDPDSTSPEEVSALLSSASRLVEVSEEDLIGWSSTGRLTFDPSASRAPPDLVADVRGAIVAYSSNMACGRRTAEAAADAVASILGIRAPSGIRDLVVGREGPAVRLTR